MTYPVLFTSTYHHDTSQQGVASGVSSVIHEFPSDAAATIAITKLIPSVYGGSTKDPHVTHHAIKLY